ncbi:MAG: circadian clock protein KaiC [Alphaproteobacteria bacterium]|nr:circadian clock protein KaiC [Alphaproteobacteria bacterium]
MSSGIEGLDRALGGGLPRGRTTLVIGGPGAGKTMFGMQSLCVAARRDDEAGIFVTFEEHPADLIAHFAEFPWGVPDLVARGRIVVVDARLDPNAMIDGGFEIDGLLRIVAVRAQAIGAKRVVFDGIDVLFSLLPTPRDALLQMFVLDRFLRESGLSTVIALKSGGLGDFDATFSAVQYIADCVLRFDRRIASHIVSTTLEVVKYRGSATPTACLPVTVGGQGIDVLFEPPVERGAVPSTQRVTSGIPRLDTMLAGGYYRGSTILISGSPGTAKTSLAAVLVNAACQNGERALFVSFDEPEEQIVRNMRSIGIEFDTHRAAGLLRMKNMRAASASAPEHFQRLRLEAEEFRPAVLIVDPVSALTKAGGAALANALIEVMVDYVKGRGVTTVFTALVDDVDPEREVTLNHVSTIADVWLHLTFVPHGGERNRALSIVKARGAGHSNQVRELILSDDGPSLADVYSSSGVVLMGTARLEREAEEAAGEIERRFGQDTRRKEAQIRLKEVEGRLAAAKVELEARISELDMLETEEQRLSGMQIERTRSIRRSRRADGP